MATFYDQLQRAINLAAVPKRIISVVPSQTELLFDLGLTEEVIGITKFCIHPADKFKTTTKVGGTKQLNIELIKQLNPDLIIANKEENERSQIEELMNFCPVWISDISNLDEATDMISRVGQLVDREEQAGKLNQTIREKFDLLNLPPLQLSIAYFIWRKPYMVAGKNTFINSMLAKCGLKNAFDLERYPEINNKMLIHANPDVVFLSSEPYPFGQKHIDEFKGLLPKAKIMLVDGELFSWYGSRLLHSPAYYNMLVKRLVELD
ncbi:MAG: ABC-type Fe3+-hydroxamate transport system, substrate-binding protein [Mucilaginibacter sp.]|nr:ABC-type Fe3+-hydroxamate transport system, substrate-binding protein [Mucilaginibacter sp.]